MSCENYPIKGLLCAFDTSRPQTGACLGQYLNEKGQIQAKTGKFSRIAHPKVGVLKVVCPPKPVQNGQIPIQEDRWAGL